MFSPEEKMFHLKKLKALGIERDAIGDIQEMHSNYAFNRTVQNENDKKTGIKFAYDIANYVKPDNYLDEILKTEKLTPKQKSYALSEAMRLYNLEDKIRRNQQAKELLKLQSDIDEATNSDGGSIVINATEDLRDKTLYNIGKAYKDAIDKNETQRAESIKKSLQENQENILNLPVLKKTYKIDDEYGAASAISKLFKIKEGLKNKSPEVALRVMPQIDKKINQASKIFVKELMNSKGNLPPYSVLPKSIQKVLKKDIYSQVVTGRITKKNESGLINPYKIDKDEAIKVFSNAVQSFPMVINRNKDELGYDANKLLHNITPEIVTTAIKDFAQNKLGIPVGEKIKFGPKTQKAFLDYLIKNWSNIEELSGE